MSKFKKGDIVRYIEDRHHKRMGTQAVTRVVGSVVFIVDYPSMKEEGFSYEEALVLDKISNLKRFYEKVQKGG